MTTRPSYTFPVLRGSLVIAIIFDVPDAPGQRVGSRHLADGMSY